jgi:hypothetical protein
MTTIKAKKQKRTGAIEEPRGELESEAGLKQKTPARWGWQGLPGFRFCSVLLQGTRLK